MRPRGDTIRPVAPPTWVLAVVVVLLLASPVGAAYAAPLPKILTGWYTRYCVRPTTIYYTGDGSGVIGILRPRGGLTGPGRGFLRWQTWNHVRAAGTATLWLKLGTPIATSPFTRFTVALLATRPRRGHFTRLRLRYRFRGRQVTDIRCLPDRGFPQPSPEWFILFRGRCD